jgi:hypothetical protein
LLPELGRRGLNVIVKLHDRSFDSSRCAGVDWGRRLASLCRRWRLHFVQDPDVSPLLFVSDAVVTDHSSVGFEFMLLDRPVVVIDCPELIEKAAISPEKVRLLRSAAHVVACHAPSVARAVIRALAEPEPELMGGRRRAVADRLFYRPGTATDRAVQVIYELLAIPAPVWPRSVATPLHRQAHPLLSPCEARSSSRA